MFGSYSTLKMDVVGSEVSGKPVTFIFTRSSFFLMMEAADSKASSEDVLPIEHGGS
jgi:hypothetical protein